MSTELEFADEYARYESEVKRFILSLVPHRPDAEELMQETAQSFWVKCIRAGKTLAASQRARRLTATSCISTPSVARNARDREPSRSIAPFLVLCCRVSCFCNTTNSWATLRRSTRRTDHNRSFRRLWKTNRLPFRRIVEQSVFAGLSGHSVIRSAFWLRPTTKALNRQSLRRLGKLNVKDHNLTLSSET